MLGLQYFGTLKHEMVKHTQEIHQQQPNEFLRLNSIYFYAKIYTIITFNCVNAKFIIRENFSLKSRFFFSRYLRFLLETLFW